jgi:hypothetical protein
MDSDDHMQEIKRSILEELLLRLAQSDHPVKFQSQTHRAETDTDRFDRVLVQWLDLQRAVLARTKLANGHNGCSRWHCPDKRVRDAWMPSSIP